MCNVGLAGERHNGSFALRRSTWRSEIGNRRVGKAAPQRYAEERPQAISIV